MIQLKVWSLSYTTGRPEQPTPTKHQRPILTTLNHRSPCSMSSTTREPQSQSASKSSRCTEQPRPVQTSPSSPPIIAPASYQPSLHTPTIQSKLTNPLLPSPRRPHNSSRAETTQLRPGVWPRRLRLGLGREQSPPRRHPTCRGRADSEETAAPGRQRSEIRR